MLFVLHISKINKQSHNRESPGTRATLMKAGPRSLIKGRVPRSKPRKHFKPKQWGGGQEEMEAMAAATTRSFSSNTYNPRSEKELYLHQPVMKKANEQ